MSTDIRLLAKSYADEWARNGITTWEAGMDREQFIEVIAREMFETDHDTRWSGAFPPEREGYLQDAGFMVDGIAKVTEEWLLAAGEVGLARKWRVAMGRDANTDTVARARGSQVSADSER